MQGRVVVAVEGVGMMHHSEEPKARCFEEEENHGGMEEVKGEPRHLWWISGVQLQLLLSCEEEGYLLQSWKWLRRLPSYAGRFRVISSFRNVLRPQPVLRLSRALALHHAGAYASHSPQRAALLLASLLRRPRHREMWLLHLQETQEGSDVEIAEGLRVEEDSSLGLWETKELEAEVAVWEHRS